MSASHNLQTIDNGHHGRKGVFNEAPQIDGSPIEILTENLLTG